MTNHTKRELRDFIVVQLMQASFAMWWLGYGVPAVAYLASPDLSGLSPVLAASVDHLWWSAPFVIFVATCVAGIAVWRGIVSGVTACLALCIAEFCLGFLVGLDMALAFVGGSTCTK